MSFQSRMVHITEPIIAALISIHRPILSRQPDSSLCCKTTDTGLLHPVFSPAFANTHCAYANEGMTRLSCNKQTVQCLIKWIIVTFSLCTLTPVNSRHDANYMPVAPKSGNTKCLIWH